MKRIEESFHAPLSIEIQTEYNKLVETIEAAEGKVSVSDLIAYQIGWGKRLLDWYKTGIQGKLPEMPGEGFSSWDYTAISKHFYQKYQYDRARKQRLEFYKVVTQILEIVETEHQTGNLDQIGIWPWCRLKSGKEWPFSKWVRVNTVAPYKRARSLLRKSIREFSKTSP